LRKQEIKDANGEEITIIMQELHAEIRQKIRDNNNKYKHKADLKRRKMSLRMEIGIGTL
jgi:hypothetical protein